ncbi:sperm acrosome membrane-associated protein 4-like [Misgurnus anguillicaudatus]|uniref:sperm acrosome membrane-associated protein 4-like n=1 Tax=Misgurnus anguillicaudatus TaxID=75329 RepID=UPI003CCFDF65
MCEALKRAFVICVFTYLQVFKSTKTVFPSLCLPVPLLCFVCVFPSISPLDCRKFPIKFPPGRLCFSCKAVGQRGMLYEKSCVSPVLCGLTEEKFAMGLNFTFTSDKSVHIDQLLSSCLLSVLLTCMYAQ